MKICIIGPGVVGYATGKVLFENGFEIGFIGRNQDKINGAGRANMTF